MKDRRSQYNDLYWLISKYLILCFFAYLGVGSSTSTAPSALNTKYIIENGTHKVMMQELASYGVAYQKGEDW